MPNRKTVQNWGINNHGLECNEYGKVNLIYCKICHKYYSSNNEVASSSYLIRAQVDQFITGSTVTKKNNFSDHVKKSVSHLNVVNGLNQPLETPSGQTSIVNCVKRMNQKLKDKLAMKSQLSHFTTIHGKPFKLYSDTANFKKDVHNVDLGNSCLTNTSCCQIYHQE